ncbi:MAG TPA: hypothetical protein VGG80_03280 [Acidobacteriaceae bacterium]
MLPELRQAFNRDYRPERYQLLLEDCARLARAPLEFRISETPCFFPRSLMQKIVDTGADLTDQLLGDAAFLKASEEAVPERFRVPHCPAHPHFMTADFGLVREDDGSLAPRLVELQAFPSIFGFQAVLFDSYARVFRLSGNLDRFLGGHDDASYWALLRRVIVGNHASENVVLLETEPETQKTLPDFHVHEDRLGIKTVDIAKLKREGRRLFYRSGTRDVPIERIYNRAIVDELERKGVSLPFDYRDDLDVEWAGHPNWYFRISKFAIPWLHHTAVPPAIFLDEWYEGKGQDLLAEDREQWVFKPLYSFAGKGVQFGPTDAELASIPQDQRHNFLLQQRVRFEPVIDTPHGLTQAEVRIMYVWPDSGTLEPVISLIRMGRGKMMGVDHNRNQEWVGASAGFCPNEG